MNELAFLSIEELRTLLDTKQITSQELAQASIDRIKKHDEQLGSTLETFAPESISFTNTNNHLAGIPGLIKDTICQKDRITSAGSKILHNFVSPYDATAIAKLKEAGAVSIGRANCDEFAMGSSNETSAYKKAYNPWDATRSPGGSSGGSAAAVAAGFVPWALGSETGGSVRQPASFCGLVGSKPTYGRVSRHGLIAYASSMDQIGVFTRTVYDNALVLQTIAGKDTYDSTVIQHDAPDYVSGLTGEIKKGLKIGIVTNALNAKGMHPSVRAALANALKVLQSLGAELVEVTLPMMEYAAATYFVTSRAEAASNLARFDGIRYGYRAKETTDLQDLYQKSRAEGFGHEVKRRILIGNYVLSAGHAAQYYESACKVRRLMRKEFTDHFTKVDLLFAPVAAAPAFKIGEFAKDPLQMDLQDYFTCSANLAGIPAVNFPCGFVDNMPIGYQLMGPDLSEGLIFQTGYAYEQATDWHKQHPSLG